MIKMLRLSKIRERIQELLVPKKAQIKMNNGSNKKLIKFFFLLDNKIATI